MAIPGNNELLAGDINAGYLGTVPAVEFITGNALASLVGLSAGTSQHSNTDWLKFVYNGKVQFTPKKTIRYSISWNDINVVNGVYGNKTIDIAGTPYKVRLWRGAENDPANFSNSDHDAIGSEWNRLMLPIHIEAPNNWIHKPYGGITEDWGINFTNADLLLHQNNGAGSYTWCQETTAPGNRLYRGYDGPSGAFDDYYTAKNLYFGWRPVLEGPEWNNGPDLKANINGQLREYDDGWVMVDGQLRKLDKMWTKVNGILREV